MIEQEDAESTEIGVKREDAKARRAEVSGQCPHFRMKRIFLSWVFWAVVVGWAVAMGTSRPPPTERAFPKQTLRPDVVGPSD